MRFRLVLLGLVFFQTAVFADVIQNQKGQTLEGMITKENDQQITINVDGMELTMAKSDVKSIKRGPVFKKPKPRPAVTEAKKTLPPKMEEVSSPKIDLSQLERPVIVFDKRQWKLGYQDSRANQVIAEFVLEGETVQNWTELVTAQLFIGLRSEPRYYVEYVKKETARTCPGAKFEILREAPYDVTYAWSIRGCAAAADQAEVARVVLGLDGTHVLHYAVKTGEWPAAERQKWQECLEASQFVKPQPQNNQGSGNRP